MLILALMLVGHCAAAQLKVLVLDSKTGEPLGGKAVCVSLSASPKMTALDKSDMGPVCHRTNPNGIMDITLPDPSPEWAYVTLHTNDLLSCFAPGHATSIVELAKTGVTAPNTCGIAATMPASQAGELVVFAHQMTFSEVLKAMWKEV